MVETRLARRQESGRSVLVVSGDQGFLDRIAGLLGDHRVLASRNVAEAERRIVEDRIDLVVFDQQVGQDSFTRCGHGCFPFTMLL